MGEGRVRAPDIPALTGLRSSKPTWSAEYRDTAERLHRSLGSLEHIAGVLSATGRGAAELCATVVDAAAEHLGSRWVVLALADDALPMARPRLAGRGPGPERPATPDDLPADVRASVLAALADPDLTPRLAPDGAVVVPLVVDGERAGVLVACGGRRAVVTPA